MKLSRYQSAVFALACSAGFSHADVVTLKDGKKLEGTILSESPTSIRMKYHLTPKIWDEKDIPLSDIAEGGIVKQKPEEVELIEVRKYVPTPDLLSAEKYEQLIQDRLRPFLNRYPGTKEAAEVEKMMAEVQEEKEKVVAGGAKLEGKWLTRDEAKAESLNIKAYALLAAMKEKIEAKDYTGALREFEKLSDPKSGNTASVYYPKAVEEILEVLTAYGKQIDQMVRDQPTLQRMREESLTKLIEPDLSRTKSAIQREGEQWKSTYDQERKTSQWFTPYKYDLPSLNALSKSISAEKDRLQELDLPSITKVNEAIARLLRADAKAGKDKAELTKMGEAIIEGEMAAGTVDANSKEFYRNVFSNYRQRYEYFSQQLAAAGPGQSQPAATGAVGGSSAIGGTGATGEDEKMAAALAAAAAGGAPAPGAVPGATPAVQPNGNPQQQPGVAPGGYPQQQQPGVAPGGYPQQQPGVAPGGYPQQQPGVAPGGYPQQQPGVAPGGYPQQPMAAPEEKEGMSFMTMALIGAGVVVLVVLLVLLGGGKKKKQ